MIACRNPECVEGHVKSCPLSLLGSAGEGITVKAVADMSADELAALRGQFEEAARGGGHAVLPGQEGDERFVMSFDLDALPTPQALDIISRLLPEWVSEFLEANHRYRKVGNDLGSRGVFPDINRKMGVLKARIWDGDEDHGREPTRGVIIDLVGHLFLMLHMLDDEETMDPAPSEEERAKSMARHPAGKQLSEPDQGWCKASCVVGDEKGEEHAEQVSCFRLSGHPTSDNHFGRDKSGNKVEWTYNGQLVS